jgi:hypothetical protein
MIDRVRQEPARVNSSMFVLHRIPPLRELDYLKIRQHGNTGQYRSSGVVVSQISWSVSGSWENPVRRAPCQAVRGAYMACLRLVAGLPYSHFERQ